MAIYHVHPRFLEDIWPAVESHVAAACELHPFMEAQDVRTLVEHGFAYLFIATDETGVMGFGVLEVVQYPRCRVANILGAGGRRGFLAVAIDELLPFMTAFGKTQGATVVTLSGRPGWLRALRHMSGRSQRYITWWADIDEGRRKLGAPGNHARAVEAGATLPH